MLQHRSTKLLKNTHKLTHPSIYHEYKSLSQFTPKIKKINKHQNKYQTMIFCFLLLLTFCMLSFTSVTQNSNKIVTAVYYNTNKHINNSHNMQLTTKPNISQNNFNSISNTKCIPPILKGIYGNLQPPLVDESGFDIPCITPALKMIQRKRFGQNETCFKYNNNISNNKHIFCEGGNLFFFDRVWILSVMNIQKKTSLHKVLVTYCNEYHKNDTVCDFNLLSYNLGITEERNQFLTQHIDCNNNQSQPDKTWVFKENIDKGSGIHFYNNHNLIYKLITADKSENINGCRFNPIQNETFFTEEKFVNYHRIENGLGYVIDRKDLLIQQFVSNPLLIKMYPNEKIKHVFHLRSYFMVPSYSNPFIVLYFPNPILMINPN
eukprot:332010_1